MRVLVIAAHPDDEVLGCGATISRLVQEKHCVYVAILSTGVSARYSRKSKKERLLTTALRKSHMRVSNLLGITDSFFFNLPDNRFDTVALLDIVKKVENLIEELAPQIVYTHHKKDLNIDHALAYQATLTAARPLVDVSVKEIYTYEVPSSTDWAFNFGFKPNVFVDITHTLKQKLQAMEIYKSELRPFPHSRSLKALKALATYRGSMAGVEAAEAFELVRAVR